ncbi:hypothetical protein T4C_13652 [Trichinella pseudospiralis]|uniref:Uncharacterized protein n=1 Tax=Trichinella pseudospiralis TaxID=6337 RepID=A0A0V1G7V0_TRIPS|nr:hypothetical protein T4C_13652 [Trichinella pseudospiralis]
MPLNQLCLEQKFFLSIFEIIPIYFIFSLKPL